MADAAAVRFDLPAYDLKAALALERELGISHVLAQILVRRGFADADSARAFLKPTERHPPSDFNGIDRAVALIQRHVTAGGRIVVHGDYDVDGVCATAILVTALRALGADVGWYLPSRTEDGYGLAMATVERMAEREIALLITVDCAITAVEEVAAARRAGIDVVVTDHHSPRQDGALPDCPIVHPAVCEYPFTGLCGTAVAHKLAEALGADTVDDDLELVALATVADLMPLKGENRRIVRDGIRQLAGTRRVGLRALMEVSRTDPSALDATALGFRLAPRINAAGRLRRADAGLELLLTTDAQRAAEIAQELDQLNAERRAVEDRIKWEASALAAEQGERSAYVLAGQGWHAGVIGIVASRMVEELGRPVLMVALPPQGQSGDGHGSGRSIRGFDLLAGLDACGELLIRHGGHRAAAGLTIDQDQLEAFREAFEQHAQAVITPELLLSTEHVDASVSGPDLTLTLAEELLLLEPSGQGNPPANLFVSGATFDDVRAVSDGKHARFTVNSGGVRANAVAFGYGVKVPGAAAKDAAAQPVDASFRLERNVWNGVVEPRLVLRKAAPCAPAPITVLGEPEDFLSAVFEELYRDLELELEMAEEYAGTRERTVLDRRGESTLAVITDAEAAARNRQAGGVLVVCADVSRRLPGLAARSGGYALISHAALAEEPELMWQAEQVVVIDPPASAAAHALTLSGPGFTQLAWGAAELRFAEQMHEQEYELRTPLVVLYRSLRERGGASGEELERLLRGDGKRGRSARLAGRLVRVLAELQLISLDPDLPSLKLVDGQRTELDQSPSYRAYVQISEDGQRFLSGSKHLN